MRKNKKIVALLTLLMFAVTMIAPVAGNAAVNPGDATVTVDNANPTAGEEITFTVEVTGDNTVDSGNALYLIQYNTGSEETVVRELERQADDSYEITVTAPQAGEYAYNVREALEGSSDADVLDADNLADVLAVTVTPRTALADASRIEVKDSSIREGDTATVELQLRDRSGNVIADANASDHVYYVWAENIAGQSSTALSAVTDSGTATITEVTVDGDGTGIYRVTPVTAVETLEFQFDRPGDYKVYASFDQPRPGNTRYITNTEDEGITLFQSSANAISVTNVPGEVDFLRVDPDQGLPQTLEDGQTYGENANGDKLTPVSDYTIYVDPNGISETEIDVYVQDANGDPLEGIDVRFSTNSGAIQIDKKTDTSDYNGETTVKVTGDVDGDYIIYATAGSVTVEIPVSVQPLRADDIVKVDEPNRPLAEYEDADGEMSFRILDPNDQVIFRALENAGVLGVDGIRNQLAGDDADVAGPFEIDRDGDFVKLTTPADSNLEVEDLRFRAAGNGVYDVEFDEDLVEGDYSLRIALDNGRSITFNWTVKPFGTAKELVLDYGTETLELGATTKAPKILFIDENGVQMDATRYVDLGASGYAVDFFNTQNGIVTAENDEKYLGDQIKVYAVAQREGLIAEATLTITSGEGYLEFDANRGSVDTNNVVPFQIVDEEGNVIVPGTDAEILSATVVVTDQSNGDAKIVGNVPRYAYNDILENGKGVLNVTSDAISTADIKTTLVIRQFDANGNAIDTEVYAGTLNYNFGTDEAYDGRVVVMTIGSNDVVVNNDTVTIDAAPFVNDDWRTMVPFRALAESFGAQVDWDGDAQTVTATLDGVTVVMTVGEETYTVNGVEKTADTAPVIVDDRTLVPVRFPAEAFGFDVLAIYDEVAGATASVLFTK